MKITNLKQQQPLFFSVTFLLLSLALTTTTLAQLSPTQPAPSPPTTTTPSPGFSTVPLVPVSPSGAPIAAAPKAPTIDIIQILKKAKRFSVLIRLLETTQLINQLNSQLVTSGSGGLTLFAPEDTAFSKLKPGFLNSLSDRKKVELLQFHTLSSFISISNFDTLTNPVQTQAGDDPQRLQLNVTTYGGSQVSMTTGAVKASITGTVYTDSKLAIYQVDKVLLPLDVVLPAKAPAPAPAPGKAKADKTKPSSSSSSSSGEGKASPTEGSSNGGESKGMWMGVVLVVVVGVTTIIG
ncbi:fasciclin-like arabinogalactan protein 11 [Arachis duranensis]|uniref:Fasciclin-like arabinogalactan protein 11 n=1 Tax=Arachis duranensis TaxID=130453 RepID=A0A6P4BTD3_ARADU|nr:fasciclin-like arabinogalactan protein 11 [Arachis duranensis]